MRVFFKCIYYLLPYSIRKQYRDSAKFYSSCLSRMRALVCDRRATKPFYSNVTLVDSLSSLGADCEPLEIQTSRYGTISAPRIYVENTLCERSSIEGQLPDVFIAALRSVKVLGGTDSIIYGNFLYHFELTMMKDHHDLKQPTIFRPLGRSTFTLNISDESYIGDGLLAVSLLKEHSANYYHWITEILPKLILMLKHLKKIDSRIIILVDEAVATQCLEVIRLFLSDCLQNRFEIRFVKKGELVHCDNLVYCTPTWLSLDNTKFLPNPRNEFFLSTDVLTELRKAMSRIISPASSIRNRKIYIQRQNNRLRVLRNVHAFERLMYKHGFEFIDPSHLSFDEQASLFSQSDVVVGVSGAAFTNILFMPEGSLAISLYPSAQSTNFYVFQPLADVANVDLIHFLTEPEDDSNCVHGDSSVNIEALDTLLSERLP